jgi:hypothetical protein
VPAAHLAEITKLTKAIEPGARQTILASWETGVAVSFSFLLGFDFLYDLVHNNAAALLAVWGAVRRGTKAARLLARTSAWVLWLDSGLNIFENLALLGVLRPRSPEPLVNAAVAVFSFRSVTLMLGLIVGVALHASAWWARGGGENSADPKEDP